MNPPHAPPRRDFIGKPAPPGYVAGVGRGATGFTTRSDIGPAREATGRGAGHAGPSRRDNDDGEDEYLNESNYDEFAGYGGSLVNKDPYEEDDEEADKIYDQIDRHLDERGKALRETKSRQELELFRQKRPKIQQQFTDLKQSLGAVTEAEWMAIPEVGDARNRRQRVARQDKFTPLPDSLLAHQAKLATGGEQLVYIDPREAASDDDDNCEPPTGVLAGSSAVEGQPSGAGYSQGLNIDEMREFRSSLMSMELSRASNSADSQQTATNPQDYLTNLEATMPRQITDEGTLKEYRKQFAMLRHSNPTFPNAWIASVRLEEASGKLKVARSLALEACKKCPKSPDVWCEAIRMHPPDLSKSIIITALREIPRSVKLWIKAANIETDEESKRRVYAKAREVVPKSALLWKKSVELEPPTEARRILEEAVECCPEEVELRLALARLQPYEEAQATLIKASEQFPAERSIWIAAAKLQEAAGNKSLVGSIIKHSIERISERGVEIKRDDWLLEAVDAERANSSLTCHEIIKRILGWNMNDLSDEDKLKCWLEDAQKFVAGGSFGCARGIFLAVVGDSSSFCKQERVWLAYADFERKCGTAKSLEAVLRRAISPTNCPKSVTLWLALADQRQAHLEEARQIFADALEANPDSEQIIVTAVELECLNCNTDEARRILADACRSAKTPQLVKRSAQLEQSLGNLDEATRLLLAGINDYKDQPELHLMLGQIEEQRDNFDQAKAYYSAGLKFRPTSVELWISLALVEERTGSLARARSKLEMARLRNPRVARLWLEAAQLELRAFLAKRGSQACGRPEAALAVLAKGIRECKGLPGHELLVAEHETLGARKNFR